jgi:hypothetical protein
MVLANISLVSSMEASESREEAATCANASCSSPPTWSELLYGPNAIDVPRLGRISSLLRKDDAWGTHQAFLMHYVEKTSGDILEFGVGDSSTGLILELIKGTGRRLVSFETDEEWLAKIQSKYPSSPHHTYYKVWDWDAFLDEGTLDGIVDGLANGVASVAFIDNSPMESRVRILEKLKRAPPEYVVIHDADYYAVQGLMGKFLGASNEEFIYDFSDLFRSWKLYLPERLVYENGPSTVVGTNHPDFRVDRVVVGMHDHYAGERNVE